MKPYDDPNCQCHEIEAGINKDFPECDWNIDEACDAWAERSDDLESNNIQFSPLSDEVYGCTCPTCGRMICGWCI